MGIQLEVEELDELRIKIAVIIKITARISIKYLGISPRTLCDIWFLVKSFK